LLAWTQACEPDLRRYGFYTQVFVFDL